MWDQCTPLPLPCPALSPGSPSRPRALFPRAGALRCGPLGSQVWPPGLRLSGSRWQRGDPAVCAQREGGRERGGLCPAPGAAPGARGQPALQLKQRKVRVSRRELCPRLKKHILAEERNTIQAGRETRLPSNPLQETFGSLQLLESLLPVAGLFIFTGSRVFVFCLSDRCCRGDRAGQSRSSRDWRVQPCTGGQAAQLPFPACHYLIVWPWGTVTSLSALAPLRWGGSTQHSSLLVYHLCPCEVPWRSLGGSSAWAGQAQPRPGAVLLPQSSRVTGCGWQRSGCHLPWSLCPLWVPSSVVREAAGDLPAGWEMRNVSLSTLGGVFPNCELLLPFRDHNGSTLPPAQSCPLLCAGIQGAREEGTGDTASEHV